MRRGDEAIFEGNRQSMERANWRACALKMLVKVFGALERFWKEDFCQAIGLFKGDDLDFIAIVLMWYSRTS